MSKEASFVDGPDGTRQPSGEGWFVTNLANATWVRDERAGTFCTFEADDAHFADFGVDVHVVEPGQANGLYHAESVQEAFLVLHGRVHRCWWRARSGGSCRATSSPARPASGTSSWARATGRAPC